MKHIVLAIVGSAIYFGDENTETVISGDNNELRISSGGRVLIPGKVTINDDLEVNGSISLDPSMGDMGCIRFYNGNFQKCADGTNWVNF